MRVGIFTYGMDENMTGIGRYTVELTRALQRLEPTLRLVLLNPYPNSRHPWYREFETFPLPQLRRLPATVSVGNWTLHRAAQRLQLDILHDPCGVAPFFAPKARYWRLSTVHDAVPFIFPQTQPLLTRLVFHTLVRAARVTADAVLTVSASAASDLERHAGLPAHKLFVTPLGVRVPPTPSAREVEAVLEALGVRPPYFLFVGALHPRKNLERVTQAFQTFRHNGADAQLVVVGPPSWGAHGTLRHLTGQVGRHVVLTGFVSDEQLHALYSAACALVFPSLYEGFGLPALEAMAHGTPVLSSTISSLPEVVGDAGLLVDPHDVQAIAEAMRTLLTDAPLRRTLGGRGRARAAQFTWENTAQRTLEVYRHFAA